MLGQWHWQVQWTCSPYKFGLLELLTWFRKVHISSFKSLKVFDWKVFKLYTHFFMQSKFLCNILHTMIKSEIFILRTVYLWRALLSINKSMLVASRTRFHLTQAASNRRPVLTNNIWNTSDITSDSDLWVGRLSGDIRAA